MNRLFNSLLHILFGFLLGGTLLLITLPPRGEPVVLREAAPAQIVVDVAGGVAQPGVYALPAGSRVRDAIAAAGGFEHSGSGQFVNQAAFLSDGEQVLVPAPAARTEHEAEPAVPTGGLIDINNATQAELETLPGIGPSIAQRIIEYREQNGPFEKVADIVRVSGIGPSTYEKIKNRITTQP